eukprot:11592951-Alexandrium_andersonii.AAC.1
MDTGVPCHLLLAAARRYGVWNNLLPRFSVDGDGSEANIVIYSTRPDDVGLQATSAAASAHEAGDGA